MTRLQRLRTLDEAWVAGAAPAIRPRELLHKVAERRLLWATVRRSCGRRCGDGGRRRATAPRLRVWMQLQGAYME